MRVLVTGGAGFVGSHIVEGLLARSHEVVVLDNLSSGRFSNLSPGVELFQVDLRDRRALDRVFTSFRPEVVCHHASSTTGLFDERDPVEDASVNILGTLHVLEAMRKAGSRGLVSASTATWLYGDLGEGSTARVDSVPRPTGTRGCAFLAAESYLRTYAEEHGFACTILRCGKIYGPRQDAGHESSVVARVAARLREGRAVGIHGRRVAGDDGCVRDYVYVGDVASAVVKAVEEPSRPASPTSRRGAPRPRAHWWRTSNDFSVARRASITCRLDLGTSGSASSNRHRPSSWPQPSRSRRG